MDFAVNKIAGLASKLPHAGFERPSHCQLGPDGMLYVVDWGEIEIAPERGGCDRLVDQAPARGKPNRGRITEVVRVKRSSRAPRLATWRFVRRPSPAWK